MQLYTPLVLQQPNLLSRDPTGDHQSLSPCGELKKNNSNCGHLKVFTKGSKATLKEVAEKEATMI